MTKIVEIKKKINRLNKKHLESNKSLLSCLDEMGLSALDLLEWLGVNENLLFGPFVDEIEDIARKLLESNATIISYNPDMKELEHNQIDLYDSSTGNNLGILPRELSFVSGEEKKSENGISSIEVESIGYRLEGRGCKKISFGYSYMYKEADARERVMTQKYPIYDVTLSARDTYEEMSGFKRSHAFTVDAKTGLTLDQFLDYTNCLFAYNFGNSYMAFSSIEDPNVLVSDDFYLKNMNKEINR